MLLMKTIMNNPKDDDMKFIATCLHLGLNFVDPSLDQDEEEKNQQMILSNNVIEESKGKKPMKCTKNSKYRNIEKTKIFRNNYDKNIHKSGKKIQVGFGKNKLHNIEKSKEENLFKRKKVNEMSVKSTEKYVKMFRENFKMEKEVTSKFYENIQPKCDVDVQKKIIDSVQYKVIENIKSSKNKNIDEKDPEEEKKQKFRNLAKELIFKLKYKESCDTNLPKNLFTNESNKYTSNKQNQDLVRGKNLGFDEETQLKLNNKMLEQLDGEKLQQPKGDTVIKMEVDPEFQQELDREMKKELVNEKLLIPEGKKIKIHLENQNKFNDKKTHEGLKGSLESPTENNEEDENIQLHLEMEIDPELQRKRGDINLQLFIKVQDNSDSQNDLDDKFEEELREKNKKSGIEIKVIDCAEVNSKLQGEFNEKIQKEFDGKKHLSKKEKSVASSGIIEQKIDLKSGTCNVNLKMRQSNENKIQEKSNKNVEFSKGNLKVPVDMQQTFNVRKKVDLDTEQKAIRKMEKLFEKLQEYGFVLDDIIEPTIDEPQKLLDDIRKKIDHLEQKIDSETAKNLNKEIDELYTPEYVLKLIKNFHLSFEQKVTPIEERIAQICKDYFPSHKVLTCDNDIKKKINESIQNFEKKVLQKEDEIYTKFKNKESADLDSYCDVKMQAELSDEINGGFQVKFDRNSENKELENSCVHFKEELDNVHQDCLDNEMQENSGVISGGTLNKEVQEDSDLDIEGTIQENYEEELDDELQDNNGLVNKVQENLEDKLDEVKINYKRESDEEDSYVDVEGFDEEEMQCDFVIQPTPTFDEESLQESNEESEEENEENLSDFVDINIVTEIVEDYLVDSSLVGKLTPTEEIRSVKDNSPVTAVKFHSSSEESNTIGKTKKIYRAIKHNLSNIKQIKSNENVKDPIKETQDDNFVKMQLEFKSFLQNLQLMYVDEESPSELSIEQEHINDILHEQFSEFQKDFYTIFKQEFEKENKVNSSDLSTFKQQQQTFYELKNEFHKIKEDYKSFVLQKFFEDLQEKVNEVHLVDVEEFPRELDVNLSPQTNEHIDKEFAELERDCNEIKPEFKFNVPVEFEVKSSSRQNEKIKLEEKPFDLFEKLFQIHQKKLREFAGSTKWPECCLYPSGLLDILFEDPSEFKPNVIVITLFPIHVGYSLKISMNINEPPVETFYNYATDTVLDYIEKQQLPPDLLVSFDKAEPCIFYSGCVIAEIHDLIDSPHDNVIRILLRPSHESILSDMKQIIANNPSINWTTQKKLKLESMLLVGAYPYMCLDSMPVAGLAIQYQHEFLSRRTISLNPLKDIYPSPKLNQLDTTDSIDDVLPSKLSNESNRKSEKTMNTASNGMHNILWKFDFSVESSKGFKLYILYLSEIEDFSLLFCTKSELGLAAILRVKINLKTNQLKPYILMILKILKQKMNPNINVFRRFKSNHNSPLRYLSSVPMLLNDKMYEPSYADISEVVDIFLEMKSRNQDENTIFSLEFKEKSCGVNEKVNHNNVENACVLSTNNLSEKHNFGQKKVNSSSEILPTSISSTQIVSSVSNSIEIQSMLSSHILKTSASVSTTTLPSVISSPDISPSVFNCSPVTSLSPSLSTIISVSSNVSVVSSTMSKVSSSEISNIGSLPVPKKILTFEDHSVNIDAELKPIELSKTDCLENLSKNDECSSNLFENVEYKSPTILYNNMKITSGKNVTQSSSSQCAVKTKLIKHLHENGLCLRRDFPKHSVNMKAVPQKSILFQRTLAVDQATANPQLDKSASLPKLSDLESSTNLEVDFISRHPPKDVFDEHQKL